MFLNTIFLHVFNASGDFVLALLMSIVPFVLGWLAAYVFHRVGYWRDRAQKLEAEVTTLNEKVGALNADLTDARVKLTQCDADVFEKNNQLSKLKNDLIIAESERNILRAKFQELGIADPTAEPAPKKAAASAGGDAILFNNTKYKRDDLKIVEGIGPKIAELLHDAGITSWGLLASTSQDRLREILDAGGSQFNIHDPGTWPEQARLAEAGEWETLQKMQDELKGGK